MRTNRAPKTSSRKAVFGFGTLARGASRVLIDDWHPPGYDFYEERCGNQGPDACVYFTFCLCWAIFVVGSAGIAGAGSAVRQPAGAILHTQGGVWVNGARRVIPPPSFPETFRNQDRLLRELEPGRIDGLIRAGICDQIPETTIWNWITAAFRLERPEFPGARELHHGRARTQRVDAIRSDRRQRTVSMLLRRKTTSTSSTRWSRRKPAPAGEDIADKPRCIEGEQHSYDESEICGVRRRRERRQDSTPSGLRLAARAAAGIFYVSWSAAVRWRRKE